MLYQSSFQYKTKNTLGKSTPRKATMGQLTIVLLFIELLPKNTQCLDQKVN